MHHSLLTLRRTIPILLISGAFAGATAPSPIQDRADRFRKLANAGYQALYRVNSEAQWLASTNVTPEHDAAVEAAGKGYAAFNGNPAIITEARDLLTHQKELNEQVVRQLKQLLLNAAEVPMTNPDLVNKRVEAETRQASLLNSFEFKLGGKPTVVEYRLCFAGAGTSGQTSMPSQYHCRSHSLRCFNSRVIF